MNTYELHEVYTDVVANQRAIHRLASEMCMPEYVFPNRSFDGKLTERLLENQTENRMFSF